MLGRNPKRKPIKEYNGVLQVKEVVDTFQGEGPFVGQPAIFVRLGGCNLACDFCDTFFEEFKDIKTEDLVKDIEEKSMLKGARKNLVVITGGEPLRQPIETLCSELIKKNYTVQIETNGSIYRDLPEEVKIICSPKVVNQKYMKIDPRLYSRLTAVKFLISDQREGYCDVPEMYISEKEMPIYLQPMDELDKNLNRKNMDLTIKLAHKYGFNLCLQTHKIWNIY